MAGLSGKGRIKRVVENLTEDVAMGFIVLMTLVSTLRVLGIVS